jgi:hypothetical protein
MRAHVCRRLTSFVGLLAVLLAPAPSARAYGILTHQQLVDQAWESTIVPILLSRFPSLTPEQLVRAHAYAYGGCVIQDLGYYPLSNAFFSDLTHYVRSGDFIRSLFRNAHNADRVAFAIGALTHYFGDSIGHANATNRSVAIAFPKLSGKFGPSVNYAQDKIAHSRVEFAFDISQAAKRRLAPYDYVVHVGLEVPWDQISAAFYETYGFPMRDVLGHYGNTIRSYRFAARRFLPAVTYAEALIHRGGLPADTPGPEFDLHERRTAQLAREADWDGYRKAPGVGTHLLAGLIVILPKIGPLKMLAIKSPTLQTQSLYIESVNLATTALALSLQQLGTPDSPGAALTDRRMAEIVRTRNAEVSSAKGADRVVLSPARIAVTLPEVLAPNRDLDTGQRVVPGGYSLTDETYVKLLARVTKNPAQPIPDGLKQDIVRYYRDPDAPISTKRDAKKWGQVQHQLFVLKSMPVVPDSVPSESR